MISIGVGSFVKCADCSQNSEITDVIDYDGVTGYWLSCQHRNAHCVRCKQMARDVSDTIREVHIMCDSCDTYEDYSHFEIQNFERKSQKQNLSHIIEKARKDFPRAYASWTVDEKMCLAFHLSDKSLPELIKIFGRQPQVLVREENTIKREKLEESSAARWLGRKIKCKSCNHVTIFIYQHLELIKTKIRKNIKDITQEDLSKIGESFKCIKCGNKGANILL